MKIKIWDRLILFAGSLLAVASGIALFVQGLQNKSVPLAVIAVLTAAFGGYLIVFLRSNSAKRQDFVIQRTDNGELRIAVKAIENQVQKCVDLHEEILVNSMKIVSGREGVVVELTVTLANNISIPLAVASLQKQIKQYLIASSGIEVKEVRVSVESTQDSTPPEEQEQDGEQTCDKSALKEKKAPLHQRLFGRAEEPAIVPEPPKEEEIEEEYGVDEETATEAETQEAVEVEEAKEHPIPTPPENAENEKLEASAESGAEEMEAAGCISLEESPDRPESEPEEETPAPLPESDIIPESEEKTDE